MNTIYIKDGVVIVKSKLIPAKPFKTAKKDTSLTINNFMTIDIETLNIDGSLHPYLICGYTNGTYINSFANDISMEGRKDLFNKFIGQLLSPEFKHVKYIYAHNLSGFDGIFLLKYLINFGGAKVEPLLFNGKIISIKFIIKDAKQKTRTIIFKDSYLLLPNNLRDLCKSFGVTTLKSHFPFNLSDINYVGEFPKYEYWSNLSQSEYNDLQRQSKYINGGTWSFKVEAIKYCELDCLCLYEVLEKFNELVFIKFKVNIHASLTLPSLAMRIFKSHYMKKDTIYQILGGVERDIRESYTGVAKPAVDVYIPHNGENYSLDSKFKDKLYMYDVNSLYPYVMSSTPVPTGKPIAFEGDITLVEPNAYAAKPLLSNNFTG